MRLTIFLTLLLTSISCDKEEINVVDNCQLVKNNGIQDLEREKLGVGNELQVQFENVSYNLTLYSVSRTERFYNYKLKKRTAVFGLPNNDLTCFVTFYYPADSSYFNNKDYKTKFKTSNNRSQKDRTLDSLVFVKQCSFNLYLEVIDKAGVTYHSQDIRNLNNDFFQSDSIKYVKRDMVDFAQFKVVGHFKTSIIADNGKVNAISGNLKMTFETNKN